MENKFAPELIKKARQAKTPEEIEALAGENGIDLTKEQANVYFAQLHQSKELSDDELDNVAGGGCGGEKDANQDGAKYPAGTRVRASYVEDSLRVNGCTWCGSYEWIVQRFVGGRYIIKCCSCGRMISVPEEDIWTSPIQ